MLELKNISKRYITSGFEQLALDDVSVTFRDNEFVAILGPSGSGKTTLLNLVGGLDRFDVGDLVIDGISTRDYSDRDWDSYRNNRIGFVFQSYNLIPHQSILANVELALTLSGVSRAEREKRALQALDEVGLKDHANKRPSQLSGGQMQRVAIARALINDPEILLADEPTGALDSKTSVSVMELLKEVAEDCLVIMVTHNPELAEAYATRIVELRDGRITSDSDPFDPASVAMRQPRKAKRTSMSPLTAFGLSANNLLTKIGRTLLTAFAGSIGIIGIAAILALANGVNNYIECVEEDTLSIYPLTITSTGFDMSSMMLANVGAGAADGTEEQRAANSEVGETKLINRMFSSVGKNDLQALKVFLDNNGGNVNSYVNEIVYSWAVTPQIFDPNTEDSIHQVNPDTSFQSLGMGSTISSNSFISMTSSTNVFGELPSSVSLFEEQYDVRAGRWPERSDELVLVLTHSGNISDFLAYAMGLRDHRELESMVSAFASDEDVETSEEELHFSYDELMDCTFMLVHASDVYRYDAQYELWTNKSDDLDFMCELVANGEELHIVGIVQPKEDVDATSLTSGIYYTPELTQHVMEYAANSEIVRQQLAHPDINVFTGRSFDEEQNSSTTEFDLGSLISFDELAMNSAFSFDTSALSLDLSGLNLSGIDVSGIQMPPMDFSDISLDVPNISGLSAEQVQDLFPELTPEDLAEILGSIEVHYNEGGLESLQVLFNTILQEWIEFNAANPDAGMDEFLNRADLSERIASTVSNAVNTADLEEQLMTALAERLGTEADIEGVSSEVISRVLMSYERSIASALASQISSAVESYMREAMSSYMQQVMYALESQLSRAMEGAVASMAANMQNAFSFNSAALENAFSFNMNETELAELMASIMTREQSSADANLTRLGYADPEKPSRIDIYPRDFEAKAHVVTILDDYNRRMNEEDEDKVVSYTDIVGALMSSVTRIIDMISAMLIAFVSISLIVSSIMIAVITYISVLERKKEIGILRAIGASKRDISNVFNAETFIEGLAAGIIGVGLTYLIAIPANAIVREHFGVEQIAQLPWQSSLLLVGISIILTVLAGLIPASRASHSDPVEALRSE